MSLGITIGAAKTQDASVTTGIMIMAGLLALGITKNLPYMDLVGFFDVAEYMFGEFPSKSCEKRVTYHTIHFESKIMQ